ncbi:MAG: EamA family transporter [Rhodovibrionaceae bacterium]|nr:EamA family transporter [Rhodovibrionaceae bacterium]
MSASGAHAGVRPLHVLMLVGVMFVWGMNFAVAKIALLHLPPILLVALRFALVALVLLPFVKRPHGEWRGILLVSVFLGLLHFSLMFNGIRHVDASTAAIAIQLQVPFSALLAALVFKDKLGWRRAAGMAIAFAGVALIAGEPRLQGNYLSLAMVISAACIWAVAAIFIKRLENVDGFMLNAWMAVFATPQLFAASFLLESGQIEAMVQADWLVVGFALFYQAVIIVIIGYGTWYWMLQRYDVNQTMPFTLLVPLFGVLSGVLFLGEQLTLTFVIGGMITIVGVGIIILRRPRFAGPRTWRA